jgi:UPF0755 protein
MQTTPSRRGGWLPVICAVIACFCVVLGAITYQNLYRPVSLHEPQLVSIRKGATLGFVANRLQQRGLIPSATAFKIYAYVTRRANKLKTGEYDIVTGSRPVDILDILVSGRAHSIILTIPEGKWASEIGQIISIRWPETANEFSTLVKQPQRWQGKVAFPLPDDSLEGYLFPDTYNFTNGLPAEAIIGKMLERFQTTCWAAYSAQPPQDGRSFRQVIILASLVEAEAKVDAERPIIAGVYMNRLRAHWTLDCDATLIYPLQERIKRVLNKDKLIDSPYNTYRRQGLPPGPINNPGLKSFEAALHPAKVPYFFYVARGDGSHIFSRTLAEQNEVIRRIRGKY